LSIRIAILILRLLSGQPLEICIWYHSADLGAIAVGVITTYNRTHTHAHNLTQSSSHVGYFAARTCDVKRETDSSCRPEIDFKIGAFRQLLAHILPRIGASSHFESAPYICNIAISTKTDKKTLSQTQ